MMKTVSALFLAGIAAVQLAPPAQAAFTNYTTIVGKKNGDHKAAAAPTPAPGPIAKSSPRIKPHRRPRPCRFRASTS
jgi:hypothetical protein